MSRPERKSCKMSMCDDGVYGENMAAYWDRDKHTITPSITLFTEGDNNKKKLCGNNWGSFSVNQTYLQLSSPFIF